MTVSQDLSTTNLKTVFLHMIYCRLTTSIIKSVIFIRLFEKRDVLCYCVVRVGGHMQDGFHSISQELFDVS